MNGIIERFIIKNNIDVEKIRKLPEAVIKDRNILVKNYGIYKNEEDVYVSVGDIIGYEYSFHGGSNDIIYNMESFFRERGDNYSTRSNGMLEYTSNNVLEGLEGTFSKEPMLLDEIDGKYFISGNGLHRFHVLRLLYLNEIRNVSSKEEIDNIKRNYVIKVKSKSLDYVKTYCNFLLSKIDSNCWLLNEYNNGCVTGKSRVMVDNERLVMNDEELVLFILKKFKEKNFSSEQLEILNYELQIRCDTIPSFNKFMNEYMKDFVIGRKL